METWDNALAAAQAAAAEGRFAAAAEAAGRALDAAPDAVARSRAARQKGRVLREMARYAEAREACELAVHLATAAPERTEALTELAHVLSAAGCPGEADVLLDEAVILSDPQTTLEGAAALRVRAEVRIAQARYAEAEAVAAEAHATFQRLLGDCDARTAHALTTWGNPALHLDRLDDAERRLRAALQTREAVLPADHPHHAEALHNVAAVALARARLDQAEKLERQAVAIWEASLGDTHPTLAVALGNLAAIANKRGRSADAEALYRRGLQIREQHLGPDHPRLAVSLNNLAAILDKRGKNAEAEQLFLRSLAVAEKAHGPVHPDVARALNNLYSVMRKQGREEEAEQYLLRAVDVWEQCLPESRELAVSLSNLAVRQRGRGEMGEAESTLLRVLAITQRRVGKDHPDLATPLNNLADLYFAGDRVDEAQQLFLRSVELRDRAGYRASPQTMANLAVIAYKQDRLDDAQTWLVRGITAVEADVGDDSADLVPLLVQLSRVQRKQGDNAAAVVTLQRTVALREQHCGAEHPDIATTLTSLGAALNALGRHDEAEEAWRRGIAILDKSGTNPTRLAELLILLGHRMVESDRAAHALELLRSALPFAAGDDQLTASALTWLGYAELATGDSAAAEEHLRTALDLRGDGAGHRAGATIALHGLRRAYQGGERAGELTPVLERLIALRTQAGRPDAELDRLLRELADLYFQTQRWADAAPLYRRVLAVSASADRHPMYVAATAFHLALCLAHLGRDDEADAHIAVAASRTRSAGEERTADLLHCLCTWLDFRRARGRLEAAVALRDEVAALVVAPTLAPEEAGRGWEALGRLDAASGRWADAESSFRCAVDAWSRASVPEARGGVFTARYELARLAHLRGRVAEADAAYTALAAELEPLGASAGPALVRVLDDHSRLLSESGRTAEASTLRARAEQVASRLG